MNFKSILDKFRSNSFSERDKGDRFERIIQAYLQTDPTYKHILKNVWMWNDFPHKSEFGGKDIGIDLVALTLEGNYWAIQCKCYKENARIDKPEVDSFISISSKKFTLEDGSKIGFTNRYWISTTNNWGPNAEETIKSQDPPFTRISLTELNDAPVDWSKLEQGIFGEQALLEKKKPREHQLTALNNTHEYFLTHDRGKLIMACGTGKTYTSLQIAENETKGKGLILFLVPSIALLSQTLREWSAQAAEPIKAICICSDAGSTRTQKKNEDTDGFSVVDLALPASTNIKKIVKQFEYALSSEAPGMTVVFSTYQSIDVIAEAQRTFLKTNSDKGVFDLIICDEAHRTTGVTISGDDESAFVKVHDNEFIQAHKRLYMTATPRLFSDESKSKAAEKEAELCSMDDISIYGDEIYRIGFGEAVEKGLLSDYKVLVLTISDADIPASVQKIITDSSNEINTDDVSRFIGCINALSKQMLGDEGILKETDPDPMRRAVAFCANIKDSKKITSVFNETHQIYSDTLSAEKREAIVFLSSDHVDGGMSAPLRDAKLSWLKEPSEDNKECRVLTNARCLSEGVDVPSLDAVLFLSARNSQVDVVQSVGRVMRKSPGKKYGYIIIPVVVPADVDAEKALDNNDRFRVVWTVLNALRAHDDRFNAEINKIELNKKKNNRILVGRPDTGNSTSNNDSDTKELKNQLSMQFQQLQSVVFAKMVEKVGNKRYWEQWAKNVAEIASRQIERINRLISDDETHKKEFENFLSGLQKNINPSISEQQAIEMLSQHIITRPVFEALFDGYSFVKNNPISMSMQTMLDLLEDQSFDKDAETLNKFYESVKMRASGIDNAEGKQRIIIELYDKFFKTAFPKMVEQLGIVYTPIECVDFIIHSVNDVLKKEFGRSVSDENVHILDPFTGTGTFITRLLQSGLIEEKDLERKYKHELHANEIVLLAYYIAAINIENAYHEATPDPEDGIGKDHYIPFDGICLTDTFQLGETDDSEKLFSEMFPQNSERVERQKKAPLRVIMGNPPYSIGQNSANDNAQNQSYPILDNRIANTYVKESSTGLSKSLYDAYIKAFRWSTDRLDANGGIIAFISNGNWTHKPSMNGFRGTIEKEFSSIYVFNLRGGIKGLSGELAKKEGQNVFDIMTGVSITVLVKNPKSNNNKAQIYYHDIGDYLNRKEKIKIITDFVSIENKSIKWSEIDPNENNDWLEQRNDIFKTFIPLEPIKKFDLKSQSYFNTYAIGVATNRDAWVYNFSKKEIIKNMTNMIGFYNKQRIDFIKTKQNDKKITIEDFIDNDNTKISWTRALRKDANNNINHIFKNEAFRQSCYRPFNKRHLYFDKPFIESPGLSPILFPNNELNNLVICVTGIGDRKGFASLIFSSIPNLDSIEKSQCFPLYYYEENKSVQKGLFETGDKSNYIRKDGISDFIFERAKKQYGAKNITKEDIFYYVYGFLHSPEYRELFANDLKKMLPRLPLVYDINDFWVFSKAGRKLADLHVNYEEVVPFEGAKVTGTESEFFRVEKMRFPKKNEKDTIIYNSKISISNIPVEAYEYLVNGKSAIEWIMERYAVTTHNDSGIKNDPNDWAEEVENPRYILDLLLSIINVSVLTVGIVRNLPKVKFE